MPTSIPYDPSLVLANVVSVEKLKNLEELSKAQAPVNAAEMNLEAATMALRSLDMTISEMVTMKISTEKLNEARNTATQKVQEAAGELVDARLASLDAIKALQTKIEEGKVSSDYESPVDYNRTQIKKMPLSSDSIRMTAQYFSFSQNKQQASNQIANISAYVSGQTSFLGAKRSIDIAAATSAQVANQTETHDVEGTLIITATCTHKDAVLLAPFILDVDKALRVWNEMYPDKAIKMDDPKSVQKIAKEDSTGKDDESLTILSGATYGSSFVGMVHALRTESTTTSQTMISAAASMQATMETGGWFASAKGGFGVDSNFSNDVKRMLSSQQVSSHCSILATGSIPSIKSNQVQIGVKTFKDFDPATMMANLATLQSATVSNQRSVQEGAAAARTGSQMLAIRTEEVKSVMLSLEKIDDGMNMMLDINSLMTAFEDYIEKALAGNLGVPIKFYLKPIKRAQIAQVWCSKYFPDEYLAISADDSDDGK